MTVSRPFYVSRETVKAALDLTTSDDDVAVDNAIASACDSIETQLRHVFYPTYGTRYFDWPNNSGARYGSLWLDSDELVSVETLVSGGITIPAENYFLYPANTTPYTRLSLNRAKNSSFSSGTTYQRSIAITGEFGYCDVAVPAGALADSVDGTQTAVEVTDGSAVGVGDLIRIGTERALVTAKAPTDSGQQLQADLEAYNSATSVAVEDGSAFHAGEQILIGAELMLITAIAGNTLIVSRNQSQLEAHVLNDAVYVLRSLTIVRGATGTTAGSHSQSAVIYRLTPPSLIQSLCLAEAVTNYLQAGTGFARTTGTDNGVASGAGLADLWAKATAAYGRLLIGAI